MTTTTWLPYQLLLCILIFQLGHTPFKYLSTFAVEGARICTTGDVTDHWSFQSKLISEDNRNISKPQLYNLRSGYGLQGRGFITLISGYNDEDPGIYIHTQDDGQAWQGHYVWSQQAKLIPEDIHQQDNFGKKMLFTNNTILVSAPYQTVYGAEQAGSIYVFNGTLRHWSQVQKIVSIDSNPDYKFGEVTSLDIKNNRMLVSATGYKENRGAAYVFERLPGTLFWSQHAKLVPFEMVYLPTDTLKQNPLLQGWPGQFFGRHLASSNEWALVSSLIDNDNQPFPDEGIDGGSVYTFKNIDGMWSQQQKLVADSLADNQPGRGTHDQLVRHEVPYFYFGSDIVMNNGVAAIGVGKSDNYSVRNENSVFIYSVYDATNSWSLQQKLFAGNDSTEEMILGTQLSLTANTLITTFTGPNDSVAYIFKTFGNGWSQLQRLTPYVTPPTESNATITAGPSYQSPPSFNPSTTPTSMPTLNISMMMMNNETMVPTSAPYQQKPHYEQNYSIPRQQFIHPGYYGGMMMFSSPEKHEIQILSRYHNRSCLLLWMSDHFGDGWDSAVLTVRAPDTSNDTFYPHCDQVDPFYVRYCPYSPEDTGIYMVQVFAPTHARFFWEISWQVMVESTGEWYKGDFATKLKFSFDNCTMSFSFYSAENILDTAYLSVCNACTRVSTQSWAQLQATGGNSFWPLDVTGSPYFISDYQAKAMYAMGKVCNGVEFYECYQTLTDGLYLLRLGRGLFGPETGFPRANATWEGCGAFGDARTQFIFRITNGLCFPVNVFRYNHRCDRPSSELLSNAIADAYNINTKAPTSGGTVMPTNNVFGPDYIPHQMYSIEPMDGMIHEKILPVEERPVSLLLEDINDEGEGEDPEEYSASVFF